MDLGEAVSLAGATILTGVLIEAVKRLFVWGQAQVDRFGPISSMAVGVISVTLITAAQHPLDAQQFAGSVITGILAGASASGVWQALPEGVRGAGPWREANG